MYMYMYMYLVHTIIVRRVQFDNCTQDLNVSTCISVYPANGYCYNHTHTHAYTTFHNMIAYAQVSAVVVIYMYMQ